MIKQLFMVFTFLKLINLAIWCYWMIEKYTHGMAFINKLTNEENDL